MRRVAWFDSWPRAAGAAEGNAAAGILQLQSGHVGAVRAGGRRPAGRAAVEPGGRVAAQPSAAAGDAFRLHVPLEALRVADVCGMLDVGDPTGGVCQFWTCSMLTEVTWRHTNSAGGSHPMYHGGQACEAGTSPSEALMPQLLGSAVCADRGHGPGRFDGAPAQHVRHAAIAARVRGWFGRSRAGEAVRRAGQRALRICLRLLLRFGARHK